MPPQPFCGQVRRRLVAGAPRTTRCMSLLYSDSPSRVFTLSHAGAFPPDGVGGLKIDDAPDAGLCRWQLLPHVTVLTMLSKVTSWGGLTVTVVDAVALLKP